MSESYPFPVPEAIQKALAHELAEIFPPWHGFNGGLGVRPGDDPVLIEKVYDWYEYSVGLWRGVQLLVDDLSDCYFPYESGEVEEKWCAISGQVKALELRFAQLKALLHWASLTWKHDPVIRAAFEPKPTRFVRPDDPRIGSNSNKKKSVSAA